MINGRVNESKESDFMKMKKILVSMFLLFFALCLKANVSNAAEEDNPAPISTSLVTKA